MNYRIIILILISGIVNNHLIAQNCKPDSVEAIKAHKNLYRFGNIYIAGQPSKAMIQSLGAEGVTQVINLRTTKENREFTKKNYDEAKFIDSIGMKYTVIPIGLNKDKDRSIQHEKISSILNTGDKVLIHCKTGGRVRYMLKTYLVQEKACSEDDAKAVVRKMGPWFPLGIIFGN